MRRLAPFALALAAGVALGCGPAAAAPSAPTPAATGPNAAEAQDLMGRLIKLAHTSVADVAAFQPKQRVKGAAAPAPIPHAPANAVDVAPDALAKAQAYSDAMDGICLVVWHAGRIQYESCRPGATPHSPTETFSMNKSVTALMVGAAISDHLIGSVDDPVGRYLPEWSDDPRGRITLRQLLSMCSGLRVLLASTSDLPGLRLNISDRIEAAALSDPLEIKPGTVFAYNNANTQVVGAALRRVLGRRSYADYLSQRLWRPIGARNAELWSESPHGAPRFFAGLQAGVEDWLRIGLLIRHQGRVDGRQVLPAAWIAAMTTPSACNDKYGLGVWLVGTYAKRRSYGPAIPAGVAQSEPFLASDLVFFDGYGGQRVYISAANDLVIVRTGQPRADFDDAVIPNAIVRGLREAAHGAR